MTVFSVNTDGRPYLQTNLLVTFIYRDFSTKLLSTVLTLEPVVQLKINSVHIFGEIDNTITDIIYKIII